MSSFHGISMATTDGELCRLIFRFEREYLLVAAPDEREPLLKRVKHHRKLHEPWLDARERHRARA